MQRDWIQKWAIYSPDRIAIKEFETGRSLNYLQLNNLGQHLVTWLQQRFHLQAKDRIAILAENSLAHVALFSAAQKANFTLVPINYRLSTPEIEYLLQDAQASLLIAEDRFRKALTPYLERPANIETWGWDDLENFCDQHKDQLCQQQFSVQIDEDDPIFILYTSGTTGFPKGALYSHKMLFWNSINTSISLIINSESRTINCMPFFHTGGWNVLLTPFLHHGGYSCLVKKFEPQLVLQLLAEEQATLFMGVPTMLNMMAAEPSFEEVTLSNLHYIIVGGEPMPIPLIEQWHDKGVPIRQGYGMTEVGPNLTSLHQDDAVRKKGSIGRPNFYVETRIVNAKGLPVPANTPGELQLKGPMVTPGYWQNPEATQKAFDGPWFKTGDRVREDEEGYLFVVDRIKNMFISGGENVYPAEVERVLLSHPAIAEAAVIGVPDVKWGEVGRAYLCLKEESSCEPAEVRNFCTERLAKFKVPKQIVFLVELPKNDTGKIDRKRLKTEAKSPSDQS
ncbi:MAG: AMP-binding protein [Saprospiraceae bacterium]|nr:AMP-binding protein [Saprospiraceae bacterium]